MSDLYLYVYDLTKGMARQFSAMFLGKHFDGIWHTGVVAYGKEWYFGNDGIDCCEPKGTILGEPNEMILLGKCDLPQNDFLEVIRQFSEGSFKVGSYNLLEHNCNNFSNELSQLLVGKPIPSHILDLPKEILNTPIGPMLRPLLEQAADPIHQYRQGQAPLFHNSDLASKLAAMTVVNNATGATSSTQAANNVLHKIPSTAILFKPKVNCDELLKHAQSEKLVKDDDHKLLIEIKDYLSQVEIKWSISSSHINLLFELYLRRITNTEHRLAILKIFQTIALNFELAKLIINHGQHLHDFVSKIKDSKEPDVQYHSFQMISNACSHSVISQELLEKHQEKLFKDLSEFTLLEATNDIEILIHESSISFFFNLVSAFHLEKYLDDSNALALGVALIERLPKLKSNPKTIYQMLSLLRSCLSKSQNMRDLAQSMDFDLSKYENKPNKSNSATINGESTANKNDSYDSVIKNIGEMINVQNDDLD